MNNKKHWTEIVYYLIDNTILRSYYPENRKLDNASRILNGLFGMSELMHSEITNEFICKCINTSIEAINSYNSIIEKELIPYVELEDDKFIWGRDPQ